VEAKAPKTTIDTRVRDEIRTAPDQGLARAQLAAIVALLQRTEVH
jgi:hypothetical protein